MGMGFRVPWKGRNVLNSSIIVSFAKTARLQEKIYSYDWAFHCHVFENSFYPGVNATSSNELFPKFWRSGNQISSDAASFPRETSWFVHKNHAICLNKGTELKFIPEIFYNFCRIMDLERQNLRSIGLLRKHLSTCNLFSEIVFNRFIETLLNISVWNLLSQIYEFWHKKFMRMT